MIDKKKLKKFLSSRYSLSVKKFVLDTLRSIPDSPTGNVQVLICISDLDIFQKDVIKFTDEYYVIDFVYLESLELEIMDFYIDILREMLNFDIDFNLIDNVNNTTFLLEHGVLLSNVEYLKVKREQKLKQVADRSDEIGGDYDDDDDDDSFLDF